MPPAVIIVGYKTMLRGDIAALTPEFAANKSLKDPAKIAADIREKQDVYQIEAKDQPYTGTFAEVSLIDPHNHAPLTYRPKDGLSVAAAVGNYLMTAYKGCWEDELGHDQEPAAVFIGFEPRIFLKMLGLERSLPGCGPRLPLRMWYDNAEHRDIVEAICPRDFKRLTLQTAVKARRPLDAAGAAKWDEHLKDWPGPGVDTKKDVWIAAALALQLGLIGRGKPSAT